MFEWGLNWCIANTAHHYLNIHAAVVEKDGQAVVMPGSPGSGKSTLCAAMVHQGWRLLSDEMALLCVRTGLLAPIPRPVGLKNQSIHIVQKLSQDIIINNPVHDTAKGSVAHMRPPASSVSAAGEQARPRMVVFPTFKAGSDTELKPLSKGKTLLKIADNSFNYNILGPLGFDCLTTLLDRTDGYQLTYSSLDSAITEITGLLDRA
jgi:HprK-related kinase A